MGKTLDCWFSRILQQRGADYIRSGQLLDREVIRNIDRIINDIINARIDYGTYGYCILYPAVFSNLLSYTTSKVVSLQAIQFSLMYTSSAVSKGDIKVVSMSNIDFLASQGNGITYIDPGMQTNIDAALRDTIRDFNKYRIINDALRRVQMTQNVYELQFVPGLLKQYLRNNGDY